MVDRIKIGMSRHIPITSYCLRISIPFSISGPKNIIDNTLYDLPKEIANNDLNVTKVLNDAICNKLKIQSLQKIDTIKRFKLFHRKFKIELCEELKIEKFSSFACDSIIKELDKVISERKKNEKKDN